LRPQKRRRAAALQGGRVRGADRSFVFLALAEGFVEEDGGSGGGVEAFDVRGHGDVDACVGGMDDVFGEACAFVADQESDGLAPIYLPGREGDVGIFVDARGERVDAVEFELREEDGERHSGNDGEMKGGSGRGAKRFWREGAGGAALAGGRSDGGSGSESGGGTEDGADVAGILDAGEDDEQRGGGAGWSGEEVVEFKFAGLGEGGYALGMLGVGDAFKEAIGGAKDWEADVGAADEWGETFTMAFTGFAEKDGFNAASGTESFFDEAGAFDADGTVFGGEASTESDAELLEPAIVAAGEEIGGGGGFGGGGHGRKGSKG
jgi:hypothetical protein